MREEVQVQGEVLGLGADLILKKGFFEMKVDLQRRGEGLRLMGRLS